MISFQKTGQRFAILPRRALRFAMRLSPILVLLGCFSVTVLVTVVAALNVRRENDVRFEHLSDQLTATIRARMVSGENVLLHTRAFFVGQHEVTLYEFRDFVQALDIQDRYPGLGQLQYSTRVPANRLASFEALMKEGGAPTFRVWPRGGTSSDFFPMTFHEPHDEKTAKETGFNSFSNPVWREAMERARDSGEPALSRIINLPDELPQKGFVLFVPVYRPGAPSATSEERQAALIGFVHGVFHADELFGPVISEFIEKNSIDAEIYDGVVLKADALLFASPAWREDGGPTERVFSREIPIDIGGLHWTVKVHSLPGFEPPSARHLPWSVFFAGFAMSLLLYRSSKTSETLISEKQNLLDESQQVNRSKDDFLATLSHELRTPLGVIQGHAEILMDADVPRDIRDSIEAIHRNAKVQTRIIDDLLEVSSIITGKLQLNPRRVDLRETLTAAAESVLFSAQAKAIRLEISAPEELVVIGDPTRLQQVFWNLLTNAVKFTPTGGSICVHAERRGSNAELRFVDSGQGIDPRFLPFVFDRFRQEDGSTTRRFGGLGLGLAIVQNLVQLHGGTVVARSEGRGRGSEFIITLPLSKSREDFDDPTHSPPPRRPGPQLNGVRILVVDDDSDSRAIAQKTLEQAGAQVHSVSSAPEALAEYRAFAPQLMISDIGMPDQNGHDLLRRIREDEERNGREKTPAIALTAFAQAKDRIDALDAGFQAHLTKPFSTRELTETAAHLLSPGAS